MSSPRYRSRSRSRSRSCHHHHHRSRNASPSPFNDPAKSPQENLAEYWTRFHAKKQGKVTSIFPRSLYATLHPGDNPKDVSDGPRPDAVVTAKNAAESYEAAAKECRERVKRARAECHRINEKFTDPDFDIESDPMDNCLYGLDRPEDDFFFMFGGRDNPRHARDPRGRDTDRGQVRGRTRPEEDGARERKASGSPPPRPKRDGVGCGLEPTPGSVHRVDWIFENPKFTVNGYSSSDIKQGSNGDCWWLAAVATIAHRADLMDRVCVARDEECGVYGFCFYRDGEWVPVVVDDNLYLEREDFDYYGDVYDPSGKRAARHRQRYQTGSEALHFARCDDPNETWLPLMEKAYAKVHCDYAAIEGGWSSEGVEDMTGGVGTTIAASKILSKEKLWRELAGSDGEFVFALSAMGTGWDRTRNGLALGHAYSILQAIEATDENGERVRLVKIRNPWGERDSYGLGEWTGSWSDGSKEWTPYWLSKLSHTFGDDGVFWMSFSDMLSTFKWVHRTRLFDSRWTVISAWTSSSISWVSGFLRKKFRVKVTKPGTVVVVLSQLDDRYFVGLEGQYYFELQFVLQREGGEHVCGARQVHKWENRSISCEVDLEAGVYEVVPKITASRRYKTVKSVGEMVQKYAEDNPQKVRQVGMQYDLAHAKPGVSDYDRDMEKAQEKKKKKKEDKKKKEKAKEKKQKEKEKKAAQKEKERQKKRRERQRKQQEKAKKAAEKEAEEKKARNEDRQKRRDEKAQKEAEKKEEDGEAKAPETDPKASDTTPSAEGVAPKTDVPAPEAESSTEKGTSPAEDGATPTTPLSEVSKSELPAEGAEAPEKTTDTEAQAAPAPPGDISDDEEIASIISLSDIETDDSPEPSEAESESESESESELEANADNLPPPPPPPVDPLLPNQKTLSSPPWNPVCVLGLRVYALDPDVSVKLEEVEDEKKDEEKGEKEKQDGKPGDKTTQTVSV